MSIHLTPDQVWREIDRHLFAVLGMVTAQGEARTVGIVYVVADHMLYIAHNPHALTSRPRSPSETSAPSRRLRQQMRLRTLRISSPSPVLM